MDPFDVDPHKVLLRSSLDRSDDRLAGKPGPHCVERGQEQEPLDGNQQVLSRADVVSDDVSQTIKAYIAEIDRKLTEQLNLVMHHADFQQLESAWRGLHYLVNNTETDETLKLRVFNISKKDLGKTLKKYKGTAWDQSPLFKKLYTEEYSQLGGEPYGCIVGD